MKEFELIQSFAKGKASDSTKQSVKNAVIYTRVSRKEQADTIADTLLTPAWTAR
jgi:hypothetical protein